MNKLNANELKELQLWQKRMITVSSTTMAALIFAAGADLIIGISRMVASFAFLVFIALVGLGIFIQFSQKCPRCGYRLGFQSRLLLPRNCKKCGVGLK
jgi:hypothetical protein